MQQQVGAPVVVRSQAVVRSQVEVRSQVVGGGDEDPAAGRGPGGGEDPAANRSPGGGGEEPGSGWWW